MSAPLKVVIADDTAEMRSLLRWALERDDAAEAVVIVGEAATGDEAVRLVADLAPDAIVLDLQMPGPPPGELLAAIAQAAPRVPIVTFSGFEPELVAPVEARLVALHIPKTTDLVLVRAAIVGVARAAGDV
jgi:DNA-binding NarL/FixJ family response regulator